MKCYDVGYCSCQAPLLNLPFFFLSLCHLLELLISAIAWIGIHEDAQALVRQISNGNLLLIFIEGIDAEFQKLGQVFGTYRLGNTFPGVAFTAIAHQFAGEIRYAVFAAHKVQIDSVVQIRISLGRFGRLQLGRL